MTQVLLASLNTAVERLLVTDAEVRLGDVITLAQDFVLAGGKGVNSARVLLQLQGLLPNDTHIDPLLVGYLSGLTGDLVRASLSEELLTGIWVDSGTPTRVNEVLVEAGNGGRATVFNAVGSEVVPSAWEQLLAEIRKLCGTASGLVCSGSIPLGIPASAYADLIRIASEHGMWSVLDSHGGPLEAGAAASPTIIKVNRDEIHALNPDVSAQICAWRDTGTLAVIITDGPSSILAVTPQGTFEVHPPDVESISAVGSGDAFTAGLIHALCATEWQDWEYALRLAAACGASNAASLRARLSAQLDIADLMGRTKIHLLPPLSCNNT